ncbi:zinc finger BED domain-containing protein RICESLEEPER 2-like protein, partial [Tanacetum coccineum]
RLKVDIESGSGKYMEKQEGVRNTEVDICLHDGTKRRDEKFYILGWWKQNSEKLRVLSQVARHALAKPIFMVASQSAFSTGVPMEMSDVLHALLRQFVDNYVLDYWGKLSYWKYLEAAWESGEFHSPIFTLFSWDGNDAKVSLMRKVKLGRLASETVGLHAEFP